MIPYAGGRRTQLLKVTEKPHRFGPAQILDISSFKEISFSSIFTTGVTSVIFFSSSNKYVAGPKKSDVCSEKALEKKIGNFLLFSPFLEIPRSVRIFFWYKG